jgi:hypothetical protein
MYSWKNHRDETSNMMDLAQVRSMCGSRLWNDFYELKLEALCKKNQRFGMEDQRLVSSATCNSSQIMACSVNNNNKDR